MVKVCDLLITRGKLNVPYEVVGRILATLGFGGRDRARMWYNIFKGMQVEGTAVGGSQAARNVSGIIGGMRKVSRAYFTPSDPPSS